MPFLRFTQTKTLHGVLVVALFSIFTVYLSSLDTMAQFAISPLIIGIILGMIYGNTLKVKSPLHWHAGILFSGKHILRAGIILYGFRITFQTIYEVGLTAIF